MSEKLSGWADDGVQVEHALGSGHSVWFRQITGITWGRLINSKHFNFELFDYWIGEDYPRQPASADEDYPSNRRPRLLKLLREARESNDTVQPQPTPTVAKIAAEVAADVEQITRLAWEAIEHGLTYEGVTVGKTIIAKAITAALAPLQAELEQVRSERNNRQSQLEIAQTNFINTRAELEQAKAAADCGPHCSLAAAIEGDKMALMQMGENLRDLRARLATAEAMLSRIAYPRRGTYDERMTLQQFADQIQNEMPYLRQQ